MIIFNIIYADRPYVDFYFFNYNFVFVYVYFGCPDKKFSANVSRTAVSRRGYFVPLSPKLLTVSFNNSGCLFVFFYLGKENGAML